MSARARRRQKQTVADLSSQLQNLLNRNNHLEQQNRSIVGLAINVARENQILRNNILKQLGHGIDHPVLTSNLNDNASHPMHAMVRSPIAVDFPVGNNFAQFPSNYSVYPAQLTNPISNLNLQALAQLTANLSPRFIAANCSTSRMAADASGLHVRGTKKL